MLLSQLALLSRFWEKVDNLGEGIETITPGLLENSSRLVTLALPAGPGG